MVGTRDMRGNNRNAYMVLAGKPEGKRPTQNLGVEGRVILKMVSKIVRENSEWIYLCQDRGSWWAVCECGNEPSVSIKLREFSCLFEELLAF
jgi:hypothetical protein